MNRADAIRKQVEAIEKDLIKLRELLKEGSCLKDKNGSPFRDAALVPHAKHLLGIHTKLSEEIS